MTDIRTDADILGRDDQNDLDWIISQKPDWEATIRTVKNNAETIFTWDYERSRQPLSKLYDTYWTARHVVYRNFRNAAHLHDERVRGVAQQIRAVRARGRPGFLHTSRKGWQSVAVRAIDYKKRSQHGIDVELHDILERTTGAQDIDVQPVLDGPRILEMMKLVRDVPVARHVQDYAIRLLRATHPDTEDAHPLTKRYVRFGASPRAAVHFVQAARATAALGGRAYVLPEDVKEVAMDVLRHRLILSYDAEADNVSADEVVAKILATVPVP